MEGNKLSRRGFLGAAAGAAGVSTFSILTYPAGAAEFTYNLGNNQVATYPLNVRLREAAARIREATGGRMSVEIFPQGQLGSDTDMLSQVRSGALHFYTASGLVLSTLVPITAINAMGFIFSDYSQVWPAMDGDLGARIRGDVEKVGLVPYPKIFDIGFRQTTSNGKPIQKPEDFKGFKIRIPPSALGVSMFKALDASPVTLNWSELYTALQTKVVDGQENPLTIIEAGKLYEVQKFCSMTSHMWDGFWLLANGAALRALPKDVQEVMAREFARAAEDDRADIAKSETSMRDELAKRGMTFATADQKLFRAALQKAGFYKEWRGKFGDPAWKILEKYIGELG
jgi:tripartite ATP-independent transporter DctP family solute receptor